MLLGQTVGKLGGHIGGFLENILGTVYDNVPKWCMVNGHKSVPYPFVESPHLWKMFVAIKIVVIIKMSIQPHSTFTV